MRFSEILDEAPKQPRRTVESSLESLIQANNCMVALKKAEFGIRMYRGLDHDDETPVHFVDPRGIERKSANTSNHYTLLVDNLPAWKDYPKRSRSVICTSSPNTAAEYGMINLVLPVGNPVIAICPSGDFWDSFGSSLRKYGLGNMEDFNEVLCGMAQGYGFELPDTDFQSLMHGIDQIDQCRKDPNIVFDIKNAKLLGDYAKSILEKVGAKEFILDILDPTKHGFRLTHMSEFDIKSDQEVWFSAEAWLVDEGIKVRNILRQLT